MTTLFIILIVLASALLTFLVLIQHPKGGGLSSGFSGATNLMGVQRTSDFLEKGTWYLILALIVFCMAINITGPTGSSSQRGLGDQIDAPLQQNNPMLNLSPDADGATGEQQEGAPIQSVPEEDNE